MLLSKTGPIPDDHNLADDFEGNLSCFEELLGSTSHQLKSCAIDRKGETTELLVRCACFDARVPILLFEKVQIQVQDFHRLLSTPVAMLHPSIYQEIGGQ